MASNSMDQSEATAAASAAAPSATATNSTRINENRSTNAIVKKTQFQEMVRTRNVRRAISFLRQYIREEGEEAGKTLLLEDELGRNLLNIAFEKASLDVSFELIDMGGRELVLAKTKHEEKYHINLICHVCHHVRMNRTKILLKLIKVGGKDLVLGTSVDERSNTLQAVANQGVIEPEVTLKLIDVGGRDLARMRDKEGNNALHIVAPFSSVEVISKIIELGGRNLVLEKNNEGMTPMAVLIR